MLYITHTHTQNLSSDLRGEALSTDNDWTKNKPTNLPRVTLSRNSLKDATISRVRDFDLERDLEALSMASGWSWGASRRTFATMVMAATFLSGVSFPWEIERLLDLET